MARTVVNVTASSTLDGRDISADGTKLDGIEANATADQTAAEIKSLVEASSDIALAGNPTTTTQSSGNNSTRLATTAFVATEVAALVDSAPATLNTLNELAAALGDDANFSTTVTNSIATKAPLASPSFSGNVGIGTSSPADELHVNAASANVNLRLTRDTNTGARISGSDGASTPVIKFDTIASGTATERMRIDSSGNVGIGTTNPDSNLHIAGSAAASLRLERNDTTIGNGNAIGNIHFEHQETGYAGICATFGVRAGNNNGDGEFVFLNGVAGTTTEKMRIDRLGNVGIGTTSPDGLLHLRKDTTDGIAQVLYQNDARQYNVGLNGLLSDSWIIYDNTSSVTRFVLDTSGNVGIGNTIFTSARVTAPHLVVGDGSNAPGLTLYSASNSQGSINFADATSGTDAYDGGLVYGFGSGSPYMTFHVNGGTERMRINSSGNVGIGTTDIGANLSVRSAASASITNVLDVGNAQNAAGTGHGAMIRLHCTTDENRGVAIASSSAANYATDNHMLFYTSTSSTLTERMRIDSSGNLFVGTTSNPASSGSGSGFIDTSFGRNQLRFAHTDNTSASRSFVVFYGGTAGNLVGTITASNSGTTYNTTSDQRLKENIVDAPAGNIDAIRVRSFDWKADGSHHTYGMIAQELVDVAPEAVFQGETEDDMWGVDYSKLVPMMIKEIQDLKAEVAALKGAINANS